jgi:hypothetical protein
LTNGNYNTKTETIAVAAKLLPLFSVEGWEGVITVQANYTVFTIFVHLYNFQQQKKLKHEQRKQEIKL